MATIGPPIIIRITGHPVPQGRPKATVIGGHARIYKPAKSRRWEEDARQVARQVMGIQPPVKGCIAIDVQNHIAPPAGWPDWKRQAALAGQIKPTGKPDLSNLLKAAEDALNGIAWVDDAQIVAVRAGKHYSEQPVVILTIWRIKALPAQTSKKTDLLTLSGEPTETGA